MTTKHLFVALLSFLFYFQSSAQTHVSEYINYNSDEYVLDTQDEEILENIYHQLNSSSDFTLNIIGHTDQDGSNDYNNQLANQRAQGVSQYLQNLGIDSKRINIDSKGELQPIEVGNSPEAKEKNRRVEISYTTYQFNSVEDLINTIHDVELQREWIRSDESASLVLDQGTIVNVPANCFEYADGSGMATGDILIEVKEAFSYHDFISENLFTKSDDRILETGGMLYVNANLNEKPLKIVEGQEIELIYPLQKTKPGMELFYADDSEGPINWNAANQDIEVSRTEQFSEVIDFDFDFSPLIDYKIPEIKRPKLEFADFPARPKSMKKPYPPSKELYKYQDEKYINKAFLSIEKRRKYGMIKLEFV